MKLYWVIIVLFFGISTAICQEANNIQTMIDEGKYPEVIRILEKKLSLNNCDCNDYFQLGKLYVNTNQLIKAELMVEKANQLCPLNLSYLNSLADLYYENSKLKKSDSIYTIILNIDSQNYNALNNRVKLLMKNKQFYQAFKTYETLSLNDTLNPFYQRSMGYCMQKLDSTTQAVKFYNKALSLDSVDLKTILLLSNILNSMNKVDTTLLLLNRAYKSDSTDLMILKSKANIMYQIKNYRESVKLFSKLEHLGDSSLDVYRKLGISYYMLEAYNTDAIECLQRALMIDNEDYTSAFYLALAYRNNFKGNEAEKFMLKAIDLLLPNQIALYYSELGNTYIFLEKFNKAIDAFKMVYFYQPNRLEVLLDIALIYETKIKDYSRALENYQEFKNKYKDTDQELIIYVNSKIQKMKEEIFFQNKN